MAWKLSALLSAFTAAASIKRHRAAFVLFALTFVSCQERLVDGEEPELDGYKICTSVVGARVYDEEGNLGSVVVGPHGRTSEICLCLTKEDAKAGIYDEYFNDKALDVCLEDAARMGYPEANDCAYWHSTGEWKDWIGLKPWYEDVRCDPDGDDSDEEVGGCSVH
ncbi:MAG: hypothetical protein HC927_12010 [Deltaproteobacteria bacterium]|nr:hypothetical protein [Deltaproteobacteria bacterium]